MELSSHGEHCDFNDEKELVNVFGGVAYDHDSMPKVIAVHTLSPEKLNKQQSSIIDRLPRNIIGIRSKPKKLRNLSIQRSCVDFREQENSIKSSSFGLEQLSQRRLNHRNTIPVATDAVTTRDLETSSPCNNTVKEPVKTAMNFSSIRERTFQKRGLGCGHVNKNKDYLKTSDAVTEVFPAAKNTSLPYEISAQSITFSEDSSTKNGSVECLDWFSIGVLAEKRPDELNLVLCSGKGLAAGKNNREGQITEVCRHERMPNYRSSTGTLEVAAGGKFSNDEDEKGCQETSSDIGKTAGRSSLEMCFEGIDNQEQTRDCLIPRKRPRKSIPRKIDLKSEHYCLGSHSTDSEETLSADERTSESSLSDKCALVVSPSSTRPSDSISPRGTKVIFRRTAGVWSVSSLESDVEENKTNIGGRNRESDADNVQQSKKICLFGDRPISPLVTCDSLDSNCKEHCYSPTLDREKRIKELIRKREKLLIEVRRSRAGSQINLV